MEDNKIELKRSTALGFNDKKIEIIEVTLTKENLINQFLKNVLKNLTDNQKNMILTQIESRLDRNLDFFLRFDKDLWINEEKLVLTDLGKCFHLKISIAAFPKKREVALTVINNLFSSK